VPSWFRKPPDPFLERARQSATLLADRLTESLPLVREKVPALADADQATWLRYATVAAASLTVVPLLGSVRGDVARYHQVVDVLRAGLRERFPEADALWTEAERSTVPPTGNEQPRTLADFGESQALALARWVLIGAAGPGGLGGSWHPIRELAAVLQGAARNHWNEC
jgi:hypothetical protein